MSGEVKVCGISSPMDLLIASQAGVDSIGLITLPSEQEGKGQVISLEQSADLAAPAVRRQVKPVLPDETQPEAVEIVDPDGVDVQTGVKVNGENNRSLIVRFIANARFALNRRTWRPMEYPRHDRGYGYEAV